MRVPNRNLHQQSEDLNYFIEALEQKKSKSISLSHDSGDASITVDVEENSERPTLISCSTLVNDSIIKIFKKLKNIADIELNSQWRKY
jgi:hypothetical protein